jgi:hypothetical protein
LGRADHSPKEYNCLWKNDYEIEEDLRAQKKGCRAIDDDLSSFCSFI